MSSQPEAPQPVPAPAVREPAPPTAVGPGAVFDLRRAGTLQRPADLLDHLARSPAPERKEAIEDLHRRTGNRSVSRMIAVHGAPAVIARQALEPADIANAEEGAEAPALPDASGVLGAAIASVSAGLDALSWLWGGSTGAGGGTATLPPGSAAPGMAPPVAAPGATPAPAQGAPATAPPAVAAEPTIRFGANAVESAMSAVALTVLKDVLKAAGETSATVTSTARTAADQARAMYNNLVGSGKGQGVEAQRKLYGASGRLVIDEFVRLKDEGKTAAEIKQGMTDKITAIGPAKVSRHCADQSKLTVFDVGPRSIKDHKKFTAAGQAEVGGRVSKFIPYPGDPGFHFEVPVT